MLVHSIRIPNVILLERVRDGVIYLYHSLLLGMPFPDS